MLACLLGASLDVFMGMTLCVTFLVLYNSIGIPKMLHNLLLDPTKRNTPLMKTILTTH